MSKQHQQKKIKLAAPGWTTAGQYKTMMESIEEEDQTIYKLLTGDSVKGKSVMAGRPTTKSQAFQMVSRI
jgi:hypothetical protein